MGERRRESEGPHQAGEHARPLTKWSDSTTNRHYFWPCMNRVLVNLDVLCNCQNSSTGSFCLKLWRYSRDYVGRNDDLFYFFNFCYFFYDLLEKASFPNIYRRMLTLWVVNLELFENKFQEAVKWLWGTLTLWPQICLENISHWIWLASLSWSENPAPKEHIGSSPCHHTMWVAVFWRMVVEWTDLVDLFLCNKCKLNVN